MDRIGLGYEAIARFNPRVVYCSINGFGLTGPNKDLPASDAVLQAYGGLMSIVGEEDGDPLRVANIVSDMLAAVNAFGSVMLGLYRRATSGEGSRVSTNLLDSIVAFQATNVSEYLLSGKTPRRMGNRHPLIASSGVYKATDGYIAMGVLDHYWKAFCEAMEVRALAEDPRFATPESRQEHRRALWALLQDTVGARPVSHWLQRLRERDILCALVQDYPALVRDPQVVHNGIMAEARNRTGTKVPMIKNPMTVEGQRPRYNAPPSLGEHTLDVLRRDLELPDDAIERLLRAKAAIAAAA
jgi:crotonobetainyl-CoA:carnitine CoA-transferase CaiB-like acyl-CoA transferase